VIQRRIAPLLAALALLGSSDPAFTQNVGLVAIVEDWASNSPISGLRCSGVLLSPQAIATAGHCLANRPATLLQGSLCDLPLEVGAMAATHRGPSPVEPNAADVAFATLVDPAPAASVVIAEATEGPVVVWSYGVNPTLGRAECDPRQYEGTLVRCGNEALATKWCIDAGPHSQICGGSSGAPVFRATIEGLHLVGVVSGGPVCGHEGLVVVADIDQRELP
jgi:hypothetical protein